MIQVEGELAGSPLYRAEERQGQGANGLNQEIKSLSQQTQPNTAM